MKHPRARRLRQDTRRERRHRPTTAPRAGDEPNGRGLHVARHQPREDGLRTGVHRTEQEAQKRHRNRVADDVRHEPDEELQTERADGEACDVGLLPDAGREVREDEAAEGDAALHRLSAKPILP